MNALSSIIIGLLAIVVLIRITIAFSVGYVEQKNFNKSKNTIEKRTLPSIPDKGENDSEKTLVEDSATHRKRR